jgi:hypothetical protein
MLPVDDRITIVRSFAEILIFPRLSRFLLMAPRMKGGVSVGKLRRRENLLISGGTGTREDDAPQCTRSVFPTGESGRGH